MFGINYHFLRFKEPRFLTSIPYLQNFSPWTDYPFDLISVTNQYFSHCLNFHLLLHLEHALSADTQIESITEPIPEEVPATTSHSNGVLKRVTYTTPAILRRRVPTTSVWPVTTTATVPRPKTVKKHRQPTVEKASKIKLQLDSTRPPVLPQASVTSKPVETKRNQNFDVNGSANRYSFVSDDVDETVNPSLAGNGTEMQGFGEAEAIIIPVNGDGEYADKSENASRERANNGGHSRRENRTQHEIRNFIAKVQKLQFLNDHSPSMTSTEKPTPHLNLTIIDKISGTNESGSLYKELSLNVPTRSNVGLHAPLRPKPMPEESGKTVKNKTTVAETKTNTTAATAEDVPQTTENALIVLNTEVVTSTSMKVSYGEAVFNDDADTKEENSINHGTGDRPATGHNVQTSSEDPPPAGHNGHSSTEDSPVIGHNVQPLSEDSPVIGHNVQSLSELGVAKNQPKYKNIFPRSIRDVKYDKTFDDQSTKSGHISSHLGSIIDKYKKQPSNETLHQIIQQLASMYTKSTTLASVPTTKLNSFRPGYNGLLTRPFNRISSTTSATTESPKNISSKLLKF